MTTEYLKIPYDENTLSNQEIEELENCAAELYAQLVDKVASLGLTMTDFVITKFSQEELDAMPTVYRGKDGKYHIKEAHK